MSFQVRTTNETNVQISTQRILQSDNIFVNNETIRYEDYIKISGRYLQILQVHYTIQLSSFLRSFIIQ